MLDVRLRVKGENLMQFWREVHCREGWRRENAVHYNRDEYLSKKVLDYLSQISKHQNEETISYPFSVECIPPGTSCCVLVVVIRWPIRESHEEAPRSQCNPMPRDSLF